MRERANGLFYIAERRHSRFRLPDPLPCCGRVRETKRFSGTAFGGRPLVWFAKRTVWESAVRSAKPEPFWHAGTKQSFFC